MNEASPSPTNDGLEPIKRVKAAEGETQEKLAIWAVKAKSELDHLGKEAEELVGRARADAERARDGALESARTDANREAERILADGKARAGKIRGKSAAELSPLTGEIVDAVLGEFRTGGKRTGA